MKFQLSKLQTLLHDRRQRRRMVFALSSLLLHAFLFLPFHRVDSKQPKLITVELAPSVKEAPKKVATLLKTNRGQKTTVESDAIVATAPHQLNPFKGRYFAYKNGDVPTDSGIESGRDNPNSSWGEGASEFGRVAELTLMDRVYNRTDNALMYPSILANHGVEGTVNARLVLNNGGLCDWKKTTISSSDAHLKIYILSLLKDVCHQDFAHYVAHRELTNVDMSFQFEITEHNDKALIEKQKRIVGNVLLFYRNSQHSVAEWHLGPFRGLFPIPYVSVNFDWLQDNWDRIANKKEPLSDYHP